jgi:putative ATP-binding cassette transporter
VTSGYGWLGMVAPVLAAAPGYFGGSMTFGELMMVTGAFTQVQQALRWFVDNYARIAEWRAAMMRVASLRDVLERLDGTNGDEGRIRQAPHPQGWLGWRGLTVTLPDGRATLDDGDGDIRPGDTVLVRGDPLSGKSTLFRAIAGLWLRGEGTVLHPAPETMMFLPHRPYLPPGALIEAVTYPSPPSRFTRDAVLDAMALLGLSHLAPQLDRVGRWDHDLPLDEQHRLGFVRALLHRPAWLLADDALASLTAGQRTQVMAALRAGLPGAAIVVLGRDGTDPAFYDRTLRLVRL